MKKRRIKPAERGSILLIAMVFLLILTLLGAMVVQAVNVDIEVAGAEYHSENALFIAEAGLQWGRHKIDTEYTVGGAIDYTALFAGLVVASEAPFNGWYILAEQPYVEGQFKLYVKDDDFAEGGADANNTIYLRSLGIASGGAKRLLEVVISEAP